jgi:hypothetical protein
MAQWINSNLDLEETTAQHPGATQLKRSTTLHPQITNEGRDNLQ